MSSGYVDFQLDHWIREVIEPLFFEPSAIVKACISAIECHPRYGHRLIGINSIDFL